MSILSVVGHMIGAHTGYVDTFSSRGHMIGAHRGYDRYFQ